MKNRKHLSADGLFRHMRQGMVKIEDHRPKNISIGLVDALMSGLAMFALKDPSLLAFDERRGTSGNLRKVFGIEDISSDTQMRSILDGVAPETLRPLYKQLFRQLQRGKVLEEMTFMGKYYLVSVDGTGYFSSKDVHCESCLEKWHRDGTVTYSHQMLGATIVHPEQKAVIPLAPEPIIKQDGAMKNDCERNAAKRLLEKLCQDHPHLPLIVVEDALAANAPHIGELQRHDLRYIIGVKQGDHGFLFDHVNQAQIEGATREFEIAEDESIHRFRFLNDAPLNESNQDVRVNFLEYWEIKSGKKTCHFSWVTDFIVTEANAYTLMRGGRARWKIENETFNTLKNQGYHFEHNFGHGRQNLSVVLAMLMMLAFAIDQAQQLACSLFQAAWQKVGSKRRLWERMRSLFHELPMESMSDIWRAIAFGFRVEQVVIYDSS
ncbi:MAG: transposase [Caldilineales bacterium]|nr:transposase [Caldilineales bacterium]